MKEVEVYDAPMCCSSGVCGASVNADLLRFSGDLEFLKKKGVAVTRYNLSAEPAVFVQNAVVQQALNDDGHDCLPLILVGGGLVSKGRYPTREELLEATGLDSGDQPEKTEPAAAECDPGCCCR